MVVGRLMTYTGRNSEKDLNELKPRCVGVAAADHQPFLAPVELACLAHVDVQRRKHCVRRRLVCMLPPRARMKSSTRE